MKKIFPILLLVFFMTSMVVPMAAAETTDILRGTPTIDGALDDIYLSSASLVLENHAFYKWNWEGEADVTATAYYLWDDTYLYVCVVVTDDDVVDIGTSVYEASPKTWKAEAIEPWFDEGRGKWKVHAEAHGSGFYVEELASFRATDSEHATELTDDGYIVELALPVDKLVADGTIMVSLQVNDMISYEAGNAVGYSSGYGDPNVTLTFRAEEAVAPEPDVVLESEPDIVTEPEAEVIPESVVEPETVEETVEVVHTAPQTWDVGVIAVLVSLVSALGFTVSKKK